MAKKSTNARSKVRVNSDGLVITAKQHDELVDYIEERLQFAQDYYLPLRSRMEVIDREVAGYLVLSEDDKKREEANRKGYGPQVTDVNIPLIASQMDEAVTFLLSVLAPDDAMYTAIAHRDKQAVAKGFSAVMNKHATDFKHYRHLAKFLWDCLKYNLGSLSVNWEQVYGNTITNDATRTGIEINKGKLVKSGNSITSPDMYNLLLDPAVNPIDMPMHGEFFAEVCVETPFRLKKAEAEEQIFNLDFERSYATTYDIKYYTEHPKIRADAFTLDTQPDWVGILTATEGKKVGQFIEAINVVIWLPSAKFGLNRERGYEIWRAKLVRGVAGLTIGKLEKLNNAHGLLPIGVGMPWDDTFGLQAKSYAEHLMPYQRFASYQMNVHQRAARKALYGVTVFDMQAIPLFESSDPVAAKIPANPISQDRDVRKSIHQFNDAPDTANTLRDIDAVDSLMQKILPTDMLKQVTDLERATQYQAAATVQGSNRRNLKIAKLLFQQALADVNKMQMYNILQYQEAMEIIDESGETVKVNPQEFRDTEIEYAIADGLKGLDKLAVVSFYKDLLNAALQSEQINANMDLVSLLNYMSTLMGDKTDIGQFKFKTEFDKLDPQQKQLAFQLLQQAIQQQQQATQ